jgi:hypothetical protein
MEPILYYMLCSMNSSCNQNLYNETDEIKFKYVIVWNKIVGVKITKILFSTTMFSYECLYYINSSLKHFFGHIFWISVMLDIVDVTQLCICLVFNSIKIDRIDSMKGEIFYCSLLPSFTSWKCINAHGRSLFVYCSTYLCRKVFQ